MPIYEYKCSTCQHQFTVLQRMGEGNEHLRCEQCGAPKPVKLFSTFASSSGGSQAGISSDGTPSRGFT